MTRLEHFEQSHIAMEKSAVTTRSTQKLNALAQEQLDAARRLTRVLRNLNDAGEDPGA